MEKSTTSADTPVGVSISDQTKPTSGPPPSIPTAASCPEAVEAVPRLKVYQQRPNVVMKPDCKDLGRGLELLKKALGVEDLGSLEAILTQLAEACSRDGITDETQLNSMLSIIKGIKPRDHLEAMLASQMTLVHMTVMKNFRSLSVQEVDSVGGFFIKLARTFTTQMDALQRYRTGDEQKVTLQQHVSVSGGQAIVGTVNQNPREAGQANDAMTPQAIVDTRSTPMPIIEGNEQLVTVPAKRRSRQ